MGKDCDYMLYAWRLAGYLYVNKPARQMAHVKWYGVLIVFRTVNSTTIGAMTRIHTVNRGWKDRSGERKIDIFPPEHTNNFILTI